MHRAVKFLIVATLSPSVTPTTTLSRHRFCSNQIYKGIMRAVKTGETIQSLLDSNPEMVEEDAMTCEILHEMDRIMFGEFDNADCSWGYDNEVFYERNLAFLGEFLTGECEWTSGSINDQSDPSVASAYESITCGVEDEFIAAVEKFTQCIQHKIFPLMVSSEPYQPGEDFCLDAETFTPCLEGLVDSCHNDDGEASKAFLNFFAAYAGFFIKEMMQFMPEIQDYINEFEACSEDQLGALALIQSMDFERDSEYRSLPDFDYVVSDDEISSVEELTVMMTSGNVLTPNEERAEKFSKRMEEVFQRGGLGGGLPMFRK